MFAVPQCFLATGRKKQGAQWCRAFHCLHPTGRLHRKLYNCKCPPIPDTLRIGKLQLLQCLEAMGLQEY